MNAHDYLKVLREDIPAWLIEFNEQAPFPREEFFKSRIVYYPGSGSDGHPVKLFGSSHSAHCFVYADYLMDQANVEQQLADPRYGFRGYHKLARLQLSERDLVPSKWTPQRRPTRFATTAPYAQYQSYAFLEVLERNIELGDDHGARRLAILFLGADGIASYEALFCQQHNKAPPFAVLLQDHGFGGNYDRFGRGGLLSDIAIQCKVFPTFLLVAEGTRPWEGFTRIEAVQPDQGGMWRDQRYLYRLE